MKKITTNYKKALVAFMAFPFSLKSNQGTLKDISLAVKAIDNVAEEILKPYEKIITERTEEINKETDEVKIREMNKALNDEYNEEVLKEIAIELSDDKTEALYNAISNIKAEYIKDYATLDIISLTGFLEDLSISLEPEKLSDIIKK